MPLSETVVSQPPLSPCSQNRSPNICKFGPKLLEFFGSGKGCIEASEKRSGPRISWGPEILKNTPSLGLQSYRRFTETEGGTEVGWVQNWRVQNCYDWR